jgi:hypothetical protein
MYLYPVAVLTFINLYTGSVSVFTLNLLNLTGNSNRVSLIAPLFFLAVFVYMLP